MRKIDWSAVQAERDVLEALYEERKALTERIDADIAALRTAIVAAIGAPTEEELQEWWEQICDEIGDLSTKDHAEEFVDRMDDLDRLEDMDERARMEEENDLFDAMSPEEQDAWMRQQGA